MELYYIVQSLFIYLSVFAVLYKGTKSYSIDRNKSGIFGCMFFYALIFGLRYGVGTDCNSYIDSYIDALANHYSEQTEIGYNFLMKCFASINAPSWSFMGFVAFVQILPIFCAFKDKAKVLPYISFTLIIGCEFLTYMNGMRQVIAFSLFTMSLFYAEKKMFIIHYILILLAISVHKSAAILLIIYPFFLINKDNILSMKNQYLLLFVALILGNIGFVQDLLNPINTASDFFGYGIYSEDAYAQKMNMTEGRGSGLGYYIGLLLPVLIIYNSSYFKNKGRITFMYNLFTIGFVLKYAFITSPLIQRVNYYFFGFGYIIGAFLLMHLYIEKQKESFYILVGLYILIFVATLYRMFENYSAFYFIWQKDDFAELSQI